MLKDIVLPDIGTHNAVPIIELAIKVGDEIKVDQTILTLESEKASLDVPSPVAGKVKEIKVKPGDKVKQGDLVIIVEVAGEEKTTPVAEKSAPASKPVSTEVPAASATELEWKLPDIGTHNAVPIIELAVKVGDELKVDQTILTLESEKASLDVPATVAGKITQLKVKVGDKVKTGDVILSIASQGMVPSSAPQKIAEEKPVPAQESKSIEKPAAMPALSSTEAMIAQGELVHAGPSVRRLAYQLGVNLAQVSASGPKGRILTEDVHAYVKSRLATAPVSGGAGLNLLPWPSPDFSQFGTIEKKALSRIKKISGANLHRNWAMIPHVTQFEDADITEMEAFRQENKAAAEKRGVKLTPLVFIMKAVVAALKAFPQFNASLDASGENLILKQYYHLGVAVDTPNGLVVPVIRDVDKKGLFELAEELAQLSQKARDGKLMPADMQGGCFSISSLGGIGGTAFTPIINAPEVAILGLSRSEMKPKYINGQFEPRLILPLSLSYDHRVIDGAEAARFAVYLSSVLSDIRRLLL